MAIFRKQHILVLILAFALLLVGCNSEFSKVKIESEVASVEVGDEVSLAVIGLTAFNAESNYQKILSGK